MKKFLSTIKRMWLLVAQKLGMVTTMVLLSVVYLVVIGIMSLLVRLFRKDLLRKRLDDNLSTYWQMRNSTEQTLERHKFQF